MGLTMMNIDMGLYINFETAKGVTTPEGFEGFGRGRPTGCPGLERSDWLDNSKRRHGTGLTTNSILF